MKITRDELLIAAFKLFMSVNYEKASFAELGEILDLSLSVCSLSALISGSKVQVNY